MNALDPVVGKNVSLSLRQPLAFQNAPSVTIAPVSGRCAGLVEGHLLMVEKISSVLDQDGNDVTDASGLASKTVGLWLKNIKTLVYDGS